MEVCFCPDGCGGRLISGSGAAESVGDGISAARLGPMRCPAGVGGGGGGIRDRGEGQAKLFRDRFRLPSRAGSGWGERSRRWGVGGVRSCSWGLRGFGLMDWVVVAVAEEGGVLFYGWWGFGWGGSELWVGMGAVGVFVLGGGVGGDGVGCWRSAV